MEYKVEKNVPVPSVKNPNAGRPAKYPFSKMDVGESVFFEGAKTGGKEYIAASVVGNYKGWKFVGRTVDGGLRIWRVE